MSLKVTYIRLKDAIQICSEGQSVCLDIDDLPLLLQEIEKTKIVRNDFIQALHEGYH